MSKNPKNIDWTIKRAAELYGIADWGSDYFEISEEGTVAVKAPINGGKTVSVSLTEIIEGLEQRGLPMPVLIRLENLVDARITEINESFNNAIKVTGYKGAYRGAFPVKVNQQSHIISEIARFGERYHHGFEVGSKAEMLIALGMLNDRESLIICNGYKDAEFIDLGLQALKLGHKVFFVIEKTAEAALIAERSIALGIKPYVGARLKLGTKVEGHWAEDSGDRSLFGLNTNQLINVIDTLSEANLLSSFQLLHFHLGSQIPNIRNIRDGIREACQFYVNLVEEGVPLAYLDFGGGLAVDYHGTKSVDGYSRNYTIAEYCVDVVETVQVALDAKNVPHPTLISESGRATVAHTAVLMFNVLDVSDFKPVNLPDTIPGDLPEPVANLGDLLDTIQPKNLQECYNDALYYRDQVRRGFQRGAISLRDHALADNFYWASLQLISEFLPELKRVPAELETLDAQLSDIYYGNFSVFQSLPDAWAIDQMFPIMPIHRLDEEPSRQAIIADLTCDCDGKLDHFSGEIADAKTLSLHPLKKGQEYYLGVFLVGAYQETLGDLHNLFGDTNVASIRINPDGGFDVVHEIQGDSISDVLSYVEYDPRVLFEAFRAKAEQAVREKKISVAERQQILLSFSESLRGYTYFER